MDDLHTLKKRQAKYSQIKARAHLRVIPKNIEDNPYLSGPIDQDALSSVDMSQEYSQRILNFQPCVSKEEISDLLNFLDDDNNHTDNILEPVFLSLLDGTMRAFKIGSKQGITASRIYNECKAFSYDNDNSRDSRLSSYDENLNERNNIAIHDNKSEYKNGYLNGQNMRDGSKMRTAKENHFNGQNTADDGYGGNEKIYANKTHAKGVGKKDQSAEADHINSASEICNKLKKNKALTGDDIKDIINSPGNVIITSAKNNRGANVGKFDKSAADLQKEVDQGYTLDSKGKKYNLSKEELETKETQIDKMKKSQDSIDSQTNQKVLDNLKSNSEVQKRMVKDAANSAINQALGDAIIFIIKPLYYELKTCITDGIEKGVNADSFKEALLIRMNRIRYSAVKNIGSALKGGLSSFFKNFISMLAEGIVNCFVGVFKNIVRMLKEGLKILTQIYPILRDKNKSKAEKGDAILKLIASSLSVFAALGIETWLSSLGLPEPLSIILSSLLTAVLTALSLYLLDKMDIFGLKEKARLNRVEEILALQVEEDKDAIFSMIRSLH